MNISYISDLHLDFWCQFHMNQIKWEQRTRYFINKLIETDGSDRDVLVIAGDLSHFNQQSLWSLDEFAKYYNQVLFTHGNHCNYLISKNQENKYKGQSQNRINELYNKSKEISDNIHPLFTNEMFSHKGVSFGGNPMWYPLSTIEQKVFFYNISNDSKLIKGLDMQTEHEISIQYYKDMMKKKMDVMISHIPLIHIKSHMKYNSTSCYFTPVNELPSYVIQGHSHERARYQKAESNIYMNCLGYPQDNLGDPTIEHFNI